VHQFFLNTHFIGVFADKPKVKALISIAAVILLLILFSYLYKSVNGVLVPPGIFFLSGKALNDKQLLLTILFRAALVSNICYLVVYYLRVNVLLQNSKLENQYLQQEQLRAQLFSLQEQVSPHFLFNSLNTLTSIAQDESTRKYVKELANVYRYLLNFHDHQKITVKAELAFTNSYLYILQERFEDALLIQVNIPDGLLHYYVPPMSLQILMENAIKHNVISFEDPLSISIYNDNAHSIVVENTYQPKSSVVESHGKGLHNIRERYRLLANKQIKVEQTAGLFIVHLPLIEP
jgi:LytS/YehU family sensor histidine kinase